MFFFLPKAKQAGQKKLSPAGLRQP